MQKYVKTKTIIILHDKETVFSKNQINFVRRLVCTCRNMENANIMTMDFMLKYLLVNLKQYKTRITNSRIANKLNLIIQQYVKIYNNLFSSKCLIQL